jgi:hypothetical protein
MYCPMKSFIVIGSHVLNTMFMNLRYLNASGTVCKLLRKQKGNVNAELAVLLHSCETIGSG